MTVDGELALAIDKLWPEDRPAVSERGAVIAQELEQRYSIRLPIEFVKYLDTAVPSEDEMHCESYGIIFWAPERLKSLRDEYVFVTLEDCYNSQIDDEAEKYLVFADFLDWCGYAYAICCSEGQHRGKIAIIGAKPNRFCASNLIKFIELAACGSYRIHHPGCNEFDDLI